MIVIIDYGLGNLSSIKNMLSKVGAKAVVSKNVNDISGAEKIVLPGVGSFDAGINQLRESGLVDVLNNEVLCKKKPVLGICLGMQLMTKKSEEGKNEGLGWFEAETKRFRFPPASDLKIPHMGWNFVRSNSENKSADLLFNGLDDSETRFYFVHSFFVSCKNHNDIAATCNYGENFACAIAKNNLFGVQFHPEKSHKFGMNILKNFASIQPENL